MSGKVQSVLVTGGAGFVGSHVVEHFANEGWDVVAVDNLSRRNSSYNAEYLKKFERVKFIKGDITQPEIASKAARGVDAIIHTAGQVAVTTSLVDPRLDFETNAVGTFNVLEAARANDASFVICSTNKVYGGNVNAIPVKSKGARYAFSGTRSSEGISEDFPVDATHHTPYGCSKLAADLYTQDYHHSYGLKTGVFRMSCIYGDRQFGNEDQGWVAWFTIASLLGKPITIYGDGKQVRDVLFVSDLVDAFHKFLESGKSLGGEIFNIGGGAKNTLSLLELLEILSHISGRKAKLSFEDWRQADQKVYISDISKAEKKLHWKPKVSPTAGVKLLADWVEDNRTLVENR